MAWRITEFQTASIRDFGGGINADLPATEIEDNECADLLNIAFGQDLSLQTRLGTAIQNDSPATFGGRTTSLFSALFSSGSQYLLETSADEVRYESPEGTFTSIKGAATLSSDSWRHWKMFDDYAICVDGSKTGSGYLNPFKWSGTGNVSQLADGGGNAPRGKYLEVWNKRLWLVSADNPNTLHYSKLGDPENWTTGGGSIEIDINDGDLITGIYAHKGFLFIFKRTHIYRIVTGEPNTDDTKWSVELVAGNLGCIHQATIQSVLDDVVFLSYGGVTSLQAAEVVGDFRAANLSRNIPAITAYLPTSNTPGASVVNEDESQYWLALRSSTSGAENGTVWIMDYKRIREGIVRWSKWDGGPVGNAYCLHVRDSRKRVMIGGTDSNRIIQRYGDAGVYSDNAAAFTQRIRTKAFNSGDPTVIDEFEEFAIWFENVSSTTSLTIEARLDEDENKKASYSETFSSSSSGSTYGGSESPPYWASSTSNRHIAKHTILGSQGNRGLSIQFTVSCTSAGHAFKMRALRLTTAVEEEEKAGVI